MSSSKVSIVLLTSKTITPDQADRVKTAYPFARFGALTTEAHVHTHHLLPADLLSDSVTILVKEEYLETESIKAVISECHDGNARYGLIDAPDGQNTPNDWAALCVPGTFLRDTHLTVDQLISDALLTELSEYLPDEPSIAKRIQRNPTSPLVIITDGSDELDQIAGIAAQWPEWYVIQWQADTQAWKLARASSIATQPYVLGAESTLKRFIFDKICPGSSPVIYALGDLREVRIAHYFFERFSIPFILKYNGTPTIKYQHWFYFLNAYAVHFDTPEALADWTSRLLIPAAYCGLPIDALLLRKLEIDEAIKGRATDKSTTSEGDSRKNVLVVAYYMFPAKSVGALRADYWERNLEDISQGDFKVHIATAVRPAFPDDAIHFIADHGEDSLSLDLTSEMFIADLNNHGVNTMGASWLPNLCSYFVANPHLSYDAVILTGNPFMHFGFSAYAKEKWGAKVILDFRDTMARNPRMVRKPLTQQKLDDLETSYIDSVDAVITVNESCVKLMDRHETAKMFIIRNGYDDGIVDYIPSQDLFEKDKIHFIYAGTLYQGEERDPRAFIKALDPRKHVFHHVGPANKTYPGLYDLPVIRYHGNVTYEQTIALIKASHAAVAFVPKTEFETPTKLFDYIGADREIVLVTATSEIGASIENVIRDMEGIHRVANNESSIQSFVKKYKPNEGICRTLRVSASRRASSLKLAYVVKALIAGDATGLLELQANSKAMEVAPPNVANPVPKPPMGMAEEQAPLVWDNIERALSGEFEGLDGKSLVGWVLDERDSKAEILVALYYRGEKIGQAYADPVSDSTSTKRRFAITLPHYYYNGATRRFIFKVEYSDFTLLGCPALITLGNPALSQHA